MKVVADTSPIHYLILIDQTDLLAGLFGRIFVPPAVEAELRHPSAPAVVRRTIAERPDWLETVVFKVNPAQPPVVGLHAGELRQRCTNPQGCVALLPSHSEDAFPVYRPIPWCLGPWVSTPKERVGAGQPPTDAPSGQGLRSPPMPSKETQEVAARHWYP